MEDISEEEREFWDTHDTTEMNLEPLDVVFIRRKPMRSISIRLPEQDIKRIRALAKKCRIPYTALIRNMIRRELRLIEKNSE